MADLDGYVGFPGTKPESLTDNRSGYIDTPTLIEGRLTDNRSGDAVVSVLNSSLLKAIRRVPVIPTHRTLSSR